MDFKQTLADDLSVGILVVPGLVLGNVSARGSHNHTATINCIVNCEDIAENEIS